MLANKNLYRDSLIPVREHKQSIFSIYKAGVLARRSCRVLRCGAGMLVALRKGMPRELVLTSLPSSPFLSTSFPLPFPFAFSFSCFSALFCALLRLAFRIQKGSGPPLLSLFGLKAKTRVWCSSEGCTNWYGSSLSGHDCNSRGSHRPTLKYHHFGWRVGLKRIWKKSPDTAASMAGGGRKRSFEVAIQ